MRMNTHWLYKDKKRCYCFKVATWAHYWDRQPFNIIPGDGAQCLCDEHHEERVSKLGSFRTENERWERI